MQDQHDAVCNASGPCAIFAVYDFHFKSGFVIVVLPGGSTNVPIQMHQCKCTCFIFIVQPTLCLLQSCCSMTHAIE